MTTSTTKQWEPKGDCWFILEMETGRVDGWYYCRETAKGALRSIDRVRPGLTHVLAKVEGGKCCSIVSERWLADADDGRWIAPRAFTAQS